MSQQTTRWYDPVLLTGLFISVFIGVGMVLTGNSTLSSLTIALLSTVITLLVNIIGRILKTEKCFLEAAGLQRILFDDAIGKTMREIADNYATLKDFQFDHYVKIAEITLDECKTKLRDLASGSVTVPARTPQAYGVLGTQEVQKEMKVVHLGNMPFWRSEFGRKYFEMNRAAIKRGVQITRIFALSSDDVKDSMEVLKEQDRAGIKVLVAGRDHVTHAFTMFDNRIVVDYDVDVTQDFRLERVTLDPTRVKRISEEFSILVTRFGKTLKELSVA